MNEELEWNEPVFREDIAEGDTFDDEEQEELFELLLLQQIAANKKQPTVEDSLVATSSKNISKVVHKVTKSKEEVEKRKLQREEARTASEQKWKNVKATLLSRMAIGMRCNLQDTELPPHWIPANLLASLQSHTLHGAQKFLNWFRASFRRGKTSRLEALSETVLATKQGSEMQLSQLLVCAARRCSIPSRLVLRFSPPSVFGKSSSFCDDTDVWVELFLKTDENANNHKSWHRAFASVSRVLEEEGRSLKGRSPTQTPLGKLDAAPQISNIPRTMFVLGFGESHRLTDVTRRYATSSPSSCRSRQIDEFLSSTLTAWNRSLTTTWSAEAEAQEELTLVSAAQLPSTKAGFRSRGEFVLQSQLGPFLQVKPGEKPVEFFKGDAVYRKRDQLMELLTHFAWRKRGRSVLPDQAEFPSKLVPKRGRKDQQMMRLFTLDQTEEADVGEVDEETGEIPKNEYGNVEVWAIPRGACHLTFASDAILRQACEALEVKFVHAVVGFERNTALQEFRAKARVSGVIVKSSDEESVRNRVAEMKDEAKIEQVACERRQRAMEWRRLLEAHWTIASSSLGRKSY